MRSQPAKCAYAAALTALLWLLLLPGTAGASPNTWSGTWQTAWTGGSNGSAEMILEQSGDTVSGTYDHLSGTIQGTVTADEFDGTWAQNGSGGSFAFVLGADGKSWSGTWTDAVSGGGEWSGACSAGACLASAAVPSSTTTTTTAHRPTATVVQCDRDTTNTTNAHFNCRALVNDIGTPAQAQKPSGTVTFTSTKGQFLSGDSCALVAPDVGASSCVVGYDARNEDAQIGTALPVTASYGGDSLFASSTGSHTLFPGPASSGGGGGIPGWEVALGAAGGVTAAGLGIGWAVHAHSGAGADGDVDSLVTNSFVISGDLLETLGIDGGQVNAALAQMSPAELQSALQQLDQTFTKALGQAAAAPTSGSTGYPMMIHGTLMGNTPYFGTLGIDANQVNAAISQMSPDQALQLQQQLHNAFVNAGAPGH